MGPCKKFSSPSPHKSNKPDTSPSASRPKPHTAATIIPTLQPTTPNQIQRSRSKTSTTRPSTTPESRRRAETIPHARPLASDANIASLAIRSSISRGPTSSLDTFLDRPSAPIPIPRRPKEKSPPSTPLTARARSPINFFGYQHATAPRPHISESLTPYYSTGTRKTSSGQLNREDPTARRGLATMGPRPGSPLYGYTPTSPLSPTMPPQSFANTNRQKARRPPKAMDLAGLPKFHPANFSSKDPTPAPPSPRTSRSVTTQPRAARGSDAQQKLHQYQRELIANATQSSRSLLSEGLGAKPSPPRLTPLRSPKDTMTPLALEGQGDYLLAGSSLSPSGSTSDDGRKMVERLVRRENERRSHPEARSGGSSPALSPAVSPAGGRG